MLIHLTSRIARDRHTDIERLLKEFYDAIQPFVDRYADHGNLGSGRTFRASDATWEPAETTAVMARVDFGTILRGQHLRAGRALLNWSMSDLADASRLSLSTIRRLEQDAEGVLTRNRRSAAEALQRAGIGFLPLSNGAIAVAQFPDPVPAP